MRASPQGVSKLRVCENSEPRGIFGSVTEEWVESRKDSMPRDMQSSPCITEVIKSKMVRSRGM